MMRDQPPLGGKYVFKLNNETVYFSCIKSLNWTIFF